MMIGWVHETPAEVGKSLCVTIEFGTGDGIAGVARLQVYICIAV